MWKREYILSSNASLLAKLRFGRWPIGSVATGESADGSWTFKRENFFRRRFIVRASGADSVLARVRMDRNGWSLDFQDGRKFHWRLSRIRGQEWEFVDSTDKSLFHYSPTLAPSKTEGEVTIEKDALSYPQLSLLVLLAQYMLTFLSASIA